MIYAHCEAERWAMARGSSTLISKLFHLLYILKKLIQGLRSQVNITMERLCA